MKQSIFAALIVLFGGLLLAPQSQPAQAYTEVCTPPAMVSTAKTEIVLAPNGLDHFQNELQAYAKRKNLLLMPTPMPRGRIDTLLVSRDPLHSIKITNLGHKDASDNDDPNVIVASIQECSRELEWLLFWNDFYHFLWQFESRK